MLGALLSFGSSIIGLIDKLVPDPALANQLKLAILQQQNDAITAASNIVMAEAQGESWLQRNWRPLTMLMFVFIIFNNYILGAYLPLLHIPFAMIPLPPDMWTLLEIGLGGYVVGRSVEKSISNWKG